MTAIEPTEEQRRAIEYKGNLVAIAKPGSGKTFVLSRKIVSILEEMPNYRGLIAISYTNKASEELKKRVVSSSVRTKSSFFGTIDKFCDSEIIIPFLSHIWGKPELQLTVLRIRDLPEDEQKLFQNIKQNQVSLSDVEAHVDELKLHFRRGQLILETVGALALFTLLHSAACQRYLRARYSHVIVDEYQDSGLEQHELFLSLQQTVGLVAVAVGDVNQSIFGFSNKYSKYLLSLAKSSEFKTFPITFNHRCHPSITNYSLRFIDEGADLLPIDDIRVFYKRCTGTPAAIAQWIDAELPALMERYTVRKASDVGILVRGRPTGEIVDKALSFKHKCFAAHPLEEHFSLGADFFCQLMSYRYDSTRTAQEIIDRTHSRMQDKDMRRARRLIKSLRKCTDEALYTRVAAIASALIPGALIDEPLELLHASTVDELQQYFEPAADDEVQLMTLHKSKGLEFDLVFHLDLYDWVLPSKRPGLRNDFDNPIYPTWEDDVNLHYVGITRARKACFLCNSTRRINGTGEEKSGMDSQFFQIERLFALRREYPEFGRSKGALR